MRLGFHGATALHEDLSADIEAAGEVGFDTLDVWAPKLTHWLLRGGTLPGVWEQLRSAGLTAFTIGNVEGFADCSADQWIATRRLCHGLCGAAGFLDIPWVTVSPGKRASGEHDSESIRQAVRALQELSEIAAGYAGVGLALEFVSSSASAVGTLDAAWNIVQQADRPNVGLALDTFEFHVGQSRLESIAALHPSKLAVLWVSDAGGCPVADLTAAQRLLPGKGAIPLREILDAVRSTGWDGVVSVKAPQPDSWERDALSLAREARAALESLLA